MARVPSASPKSGALPRSVTASLVNLSVEGGGREGAAGQKALIFSTANAIPGWVSYKKWGSLCWNVLGETEGLGVVMPS